LEIYLFTLFIGFLIGSLPTTYLLIKWRKKLDIRNEGTGNVGTMNVYEVTNSRALGIGVLLIDVLKAVVAVLLAEMLFAGGDNAAGAFWIMGVAGIGATLGHNYSPWLGFKGGRGLATTLGVSIVIGWVIAAAWVVGFLATFAVRRDIHTGNLAACILMPVILALIPGDLITSLTGGAAPGDIRLLSVIMGVMILLGHYGVIVQLLKSSENHSITPPANHS
jgi:glycerol-3-phosphate acyltransferase PlsY